MARKMIRKKECVKKGKYCKEQKINAIKRDKCCKKTLVSKYFQLAKNVSLMKE
jgi:hypothetical protein